VRPVVRERKSRSWFAASLTALLVSSFAMSVPAAARKDASATKSSSTATATPRTGLLEICESAAHGMAGKRFRFSLDSGARIAVVGGACSRPIVTEAGIATVTQATGAGTEVVGIQANRVVGRDLSTGAITVRVKAGSAPASQTSVTFVNRPVHAPGLKICKSADALSPSLVGRLFSFTENQGPAFSIAAGTVAAPSCGPVRKYAEGTVVDVAELATPITHVSSITVSDGRGSNVDTGAGTVTATIGAGVTVVTYTNAVNPLPQFGYIEVCKAAGDQFVSGDFGFTLTAPGFTSDQTVRVGQCSAAVMVPAGPVTVTEAARFPYATSRIAVAPRSRSVGANLANQTATVTVPVGDSSTETRVTFTNVARTGQVQVCKALAANSGALAGTPFTFTVTSAVGHPEIDAVVAGPVGSTACVSHPTPLPLGSSVSITESGVANVRNVGVGVSPASQDAGSASPTANLTVGPGVTTATFTNEAFGTLEVCKEAADTSTANRRFRFSVDNGPPILVRAGECSPAIVVPAGTATVHELGKKEFHLVGVSARGPRAEDRLLSGPTENPARVSVPFGGVENETVVTVTDAVDTGRLTICAASAEPTLQHVGFEFLYQYTVDGNAVNGVATLEPGACSALSGDIPVVDAHGDPIPIAVVEVPWPTVWVGDIAVDNGALVASDLSSGTSTVNVNKGVTVVTYTNVRTPFGTLQVCSTAADASTATQAFAFSVDGGAPISVPAGGCTPAMTVLAGTATVDALDAVNFHVVGVTAVGPGLDDRLTSAPTDNPATASIPTGDSSNTTVMTFTDAVDVGRLQLCEASTEPTLQAVAFDFTYDYTVDGNAVTGTAALEPGQCSASSDPVPVVDPGGNPITVDITEGPVAGVEVGDIAVDNGALSGTDLAGGSTGAFVNSGVTTVTYTNVLTPPAAGNARARW
jgi:hypothetical protein